MLPTDAFDIVIRPNFLRRNPEVKLLPLQLPYALHWDFDSGLFSVPVDLSGRKKSGLRCVNRCYGTENHQLGRLVLKNALAALQVGLNAGQVEMFASKEQHMMQLQEWRGTSGARTRTHTHPKTRARSGGRS